MIKLIKKFQIKLTPFDATKAWEMSTINNQDLLLHDTGSSAGDVPVALEFIDYGSIGDIPFINSECNIALEQQDNDLVDTRLGLKTSGLFYPELDPLNEDGTYKRIVYSQVNTMFYNNTKNPTQTWGINNIDFTLSKTKRRISDEFRLFDVPRNIYGDKIIPKTVMLHDYSSDANFDITDDGNGNLMAGTNLFSKTQKIGEFLNLFIDGQDYTCDVAPPTTTTTTSTTTTPTTTTTTTSTTPTTTTTTSTSTSTSTTTTTSTSTTTTPTTTTTTTTTPTTTTTSTSTTPTTTTTTSTSTSTTTTTTPTTTTTSTTTSTSTTTTSTTTTSTTTTTTTPLPCSTFVDCTYFNTTAIPTVHWIGYPTNDPCGCTCLAGSCDKNTVCNMIYSLVPNTPEGYTFYNILARSALDTKCYIDDGMGGCIISEGSWKPSQWEACWKPVLDILSLSECFAYEYVFYIVDCQTYVQVRVWIPPLPA